VSVCVCVCSQKELEHINIFLYYLVEHIFHESYLTFVEENLPELILPLGLICNTESESEVNVCRLAR